MTLPHALSITLAMTGVSMADDWTVIRLRGTVLELQEGKWEPLSRGDVVPDDRLVRTLNGRATLVRGAETVELAPNTIIQVFDRGGASHTVVANHQGTVEVDVEARNVEHFSVVTPFLAAVVKGTVFAVTTDQASSILEVTRGQVRMQDTAHDRTLTVGAGERAQTGSSPAEVEQPNMQSALIMDAQLETMVLSDGGEDGAVTTPPVEPQPDTDPQPDPTPQPNPDPQPDPNPQPDPDPQPDPNPQPDPDPQPEPDPQPDPQPEPDPQPDPQPEPGDDDDDDDGNDGDD
jgi:hypothetical protein